MTVHAIVRSEMMRWVVYFGAVVTAANLAFSVVSKSL